MEERYQINRKLLLMKSHKKVYIKIKILFNLQHSQTYY